MQQHLIKTNIITGFLGVGKTTAIQHLLATKPEHENWVILVNEFGEIGLDYDFFKQQNLANEQLTIKQVAGGCMCCAQGPTTQVVLNQIIRQLKPDRLLIEPSGLGHPEEVLDTLMSPQYRNWLDCRSTLTLVDPRYFSDSRYTEHEIFQQQCQIADVIVANKQDLHTKNDIDAMRFYLVEKGLQDTPVFFSERGQLTAEWLDAPASFFKDVEPQKNASNIVFTPATTNTKPVITLNHNEHHQSSWHSIGVRYEQPVQFDKTKLIQWCQQLDVSRIKLVANCKGKSSLMINAVAGELDSTDWDYQLEYSQIELIDDKPILQAEIEQQLERCFFKN